MLKSFMKPVLLAAVIAANVFGQALQTPIAVSIASPASVVSEPATASAISVSGTASGGAGITRVTWQASNGATGVATGVSSWVATGIPVLTGTTTIIMRAYDSKGATNWVALVAVHP